MYMGVRHKKRNMMRTHESRTPSLPNGVVMQDSAAHGNNLPRKMLEKLRVV